MSKTVLLIGFYNTKALGLRYLENALISAGYEVRVLFFKNFNSVKPRSVTRQELELLRGFITDTRPVLIGLSVMASLYLDTVKTVNAMIRQNFDIPVAWGGVYATMFPQDCMEYADFVLRGEGEDAISELADAIYAGSGDYGGILNLVYRVGTDIRVNEMRPLLRDLDAYGVPKIGGDNKYMIENDTLVRADPQIDARSYELAASRGCPFACSYCCAASLRRITAGKGRYVRFRDADHVIEELLQAKKVMKKLVVVHFWDEIFCDDPDWVDRFTERYKKEINLPFEIWGHPLKTDAGVIRKLRSAGLYKVVMGIQSGSPGLRRDIFNRPEKQEDIIRSSKILSECGVPQVIYDFMLRHPFETAETMRETYELCTKLEPPFELQLHGLNFLPGTDIVDKALEMKLVTEDEMKRLMYAPMQEQYDMYWASERGDETVNAWHKMIFLTQFKNLKRKSEAFAENPAAPEAREKLDKLVRTGEMMSKARYYAQKGRIVLTGSVKR